MVSSATVVILDDLLNGDREFILFPWIARCVSRVFWIGYDVAHDHGRVASFCGFLTRCFEVVLEFGEEMRIREREAAFAATSCCRRSVCVPQPFNGLSPFQSVIEVQVHFKIIHQWKSIVILPVARSAPYNFTSGRAAELYCRVWKKKRIIHYPSRRVCYQLFTRWQSIIAAGC